MSFLDRVQEALRSTVSEIPHLHLTQRISNTAQAVQDRFVRAEQSIANDYRYFYSGLWRDHASSGQRFLGSTLEFTTYAGAVAGAGLAIYAAAATSAGMALTKGGAVLVGLALGITGCSKSPEQLANDLRDPDVEVRKNAVRRLITLLPSLPPERRTVVAGQLAMRLGSRNLDVESNVMLANHFREILTSIPAYERTYYIDDYIRLIYNDDPRLRASVINHFVEILPLFSEINTGARSISTHELISVRADTHIISQMAYALETPRNVVGTRRIFSLGETEWISLARQIFSLLGNVNYGRFAANVLSRLRLPADHDVWFGNELLRLSVDPNPNTKELAQSILRDYQPRDTVLFSERLLSLLSDSRSDVRLVAMVKLSTLIASVYFPQRNRLFARERIASLSTDPDPDVRNNVSRALEWSQWAH